jgi:3-phosphoshikimate 1-carboxyvinyltransferase
MLTIEPVGRVEATIKVPGSKSLTQRALIAAALAQGPSLLLDPLASEDTAYTMSALALMGIAIDTANPESWRVDGAGGRILPPGQDIFLGNNGTATRFLTSVAALGHGHFHITGNERMAHRPISPLISALRGWGVDIQSDAGTGCPPLTIEASGLRGGRTVLPEGKSSQYLSSLLLVAPYAAEPTELEVQGDILSQPYVRMTLAVMESFGVPAEAAADLTSFRVPRGCYQGRTYAIEGDASSASYFWAAAAVTGGRVTVANVPLPSLQGDAALLSSLERMGCLVVHDQTGITVSGAAPLRGIEVNMGDMPDVAPTLAVVAAFAQGSTIIRNVGHLRIKECDRLSAVVTELRKLGAVVEEEADRMIIHGSGGDNLHGATIATYDDHRMAMSFAVAGLRLSHVTIDGEDCVSKSFPDFWRRFRLLR